MSERFADDLSKEAQLRRSPGRENRPCPETNDLIRDCQCVKHRNGRNRKDGIRKQRRAARGIGKAFNVPASKLVGLGNEETMRLPIRLEIKSGPLTRYVEGFFLACQEQADRPENKAIGDCRPFGALAVTSSGRRLLIIEEGDLIQLFREARR